MPYRRRFSVKMQDFEDDVTVVDVYDLASDIGKECEIIIEKYGPDAVTALLPKVINALELLENLAVRNEKENQALQELTAKISQLENDKIEKAEYRQRFEKEIEAIEEQWRTESAELVTAVARLQEENKRLRRTINAPADGSSAPPSPAREHDQEVLSRLSSTAEKQRATLRLQEVQLQEKQQQIDSLTNQVEKLAQVSRDLRRKHKALQNQMRLICEERSELTAIVQSQARDITALQQADAQSKKCASCGAATPEALDDEDQSSKPTFSVRELRAILHERNELKLKLNRAEEQLQALQAEPQPDSSSDTSPSVSTKAVEEDEPPVQGPLPAEPDDAPWKRNSGIRKLAERDRAHTDSSTKDDGTVPAGADVARRITAIATAADLFRPLVLRRKVLKVIVFASSLLSLISPWAHSKGARCRRLGVRYARPVAPPPPPPPPRRHSDSAPAAVTPTATRRFSDSKMDLRQELQNLNLDNTEVDKWLGDKFEEKSYEGMFVHDVPLQRSLSLDGGLDMLNHLQTIGSEWSSSIGSAWTVHSEERSNFSIEQCSLEDIPASQVKVKSRRASSEVDNAVASKSLALTVLKDIYKGVDDGTKIKKLHRCYTISGTFETFKAMKNSDNLPDQVVLARVSSGSRVDGVYPQRSLRRSFSLKDAAEHFEAQNYSIFDDDDKDYLEIRVPSYRNISIDTKGQDRDVETGARQRRLGVFDPTFQGIKRDVSLRKEVMIKNVECKSCENISINRRLISRSGSSSKVDSTSDGTQPSHVTFRNTSLSIKRTFSFASGVRDRVVPKIVVSHIDTPCRSGVAKKGIDIPMNTSNTVELSRNCDCQICTDVGEVKRCFLRRFLSKLFVKMITCRDYGRKLTYWDENNNTNENDMYTCFMNILKLLLGLWLRHLDHN